MLRATCSAMNSSNQWRESCSWWTSWGSSHWSRFYSRRTWLLISFSSRCKTCYMGRETWDIDVRRVWSLSVSSLRLKRKTTTARRLKNISNRCGNYKKKLNLIRQRLRTYKRSSKQESAHRDTAPSSTSSQQRSWVRRRLRRKSKWLRLKLPESSSWRTS